jgi:DNA-binding transcriptional LysR family regulator
VALLQVLGDDMHQAPPVLELSSAAAMRAAVLAGAGPAAMSKLAVADSIRLSATVIPAACAPPVLITWLRTVQYALLRWDTLYGSRSRMT